MKTLCLLRHAKSAWDDPGLADHDRPLNPRGRRAAATMAKYLGQRKDAPPLPAVVLCSTARRARDTLTAVLPAWPEPPRVTHEAGLYLCGGTGLLARLRGLPAETAAVLLVGHNPDLHDLALALCGTGDEADLAELRRKLPTGTFVAMTLPDGPWSGIRPGQGRLLEFMPPRRLDPEHGEED